MEEKRKRGNFQQEMVQGVEFKGKNLEEVIKSAERYFKQKRANIEYKVIAEKTRLLGIKSREIVIQAWVKSNQKCPEITEFLNKLLSVFPLKLDCYVHEKEDIINLIFNGQDKHFLLRKEASLLNSFQHLLNKIFSSQSKKIQVDCDNYRKRRERKIIQLAEKAAERVSHTGRKEILGLMNPYERRIVHLRINQIPGVSSESQGQGFLKKVIIYSITNDH